MTRINLVPPEELMDQHLFAEFREIKMVPKALRRSLQASHLRGESLYKFWQRIPKKFTLNAGHVTFFYDKGEFLRKRYELLRVELRKRGIKFNESSVLDEDGVFDQLDHNFNNDYQPTNDAMMLIRERIKEKLALRPRWYRYYGETK